MGHAKIEKFECLGNVCLNKFSLHCGKKSIFDNNYQYICKNNSNKDQIFCKKNILVKSCEVMIKRGYRLVLLSSTLIFYSFIWKEDLFSANRSDARKLLNLTVYIIFNKRSANFLANQ